MPPVEQAAVPGPARPPGNRTARLLVCSLLVAALSACGTSNSGSFFDSDAGRHAANWVDPLSIGRLDFHSGAIKEIQSASPGAVLFGQRCGICHGSDGAGRIGRNIRGADASVITGAISAVSLMRGQADLSAADIQAVAAYVASLRAGAPPAASIVRTENCVPCHGADLDGGIAAIGCFACHRGPGGAIGHPAGWAVAKTDPVNFHGHYGGRFRSACTTCHGIVFQGARGPSCAACHNGTIAPLLDFVPVPAQTGRRGATRDTAPFPGPPGAVSRGRGDGNRPQFPQAGALPG